MAPRRLGPQDGFADVEEALRVALDASSPIAGAIANNLAVLAIRSGELRRAAALFEDAIELARRVGDVNSYRHNTGNIVYQDFFAGRWDEAVARADAFVRECETSPHYMEGAVRGVRSYIRQARGDLTGALQDAEVALARARKIIGDELGIASEMLEILEQAQESFWGDTVRASASGDHARGREVYLEAGSPALAAQQSLLAGETLMRAGEPESGRAYLEEALAFYRSVGATVFVDRAERLLAALYSESA